MAKGKNLDTAQGRGLNSDVGLNFPSGGRIAKGKILKASGLKSRPEGNGTSEPCALES